MLKINAGCGHHTVSDEGWINVDKYEAAPGIMLFDMETFPWPWGDNSVDIMLFNHSLEHMGRKPDDFIKIMCEIYRVCAPDAAIHINVPHPRHDEYLCDPTHVRPIMADMFTLFSKKANQHFREKYGANSCFALQYGVDFEVTANQLVLDDRFEYLKDDPSWQRMAATNNNVVREIRMQLRVIKDV